MVDALLSIVGKNSVLILPSLLALAASIIYASSDCYGEIWQKIAAALTLCIGAIIAGYGFGTTLFSTIPLSLHLVILTQGVCGLLVTVADPVIEKLKADG
jgi:hypothetical protein